MPELNARSVLSLPPVTDLLQALTLKAQIEQGVASGNGMDVDASAVQRISTPCLQVLVAGAVAFTEAGGPSMVITSPSSAFLETVSALGLKDALGIA